MGDADASVRAAAARAAGRLFRRCPGGCAILAVDRVGDALVRLLNDPDPAVQGAAFEGIGDLRYERAVKAVGEILAYLKGGEMGWAALDTLARIGHASSVPLFKTALSSRDPNFRRSAVEGLARAGDKGDGAAIDAMIAGERDPAVILAAAFAQHRAGRAVQTPRLVQALGDRRLAPQARDYLIELGTPVAPDVAAALPSAPDEARLAMLHVLGVTGGAKQAASVEPLQKDADPRVAAAARRALSRIRSFRR
jgi:HEAT repeat protein